MAYSTVLLIKKLMVQITAYYFGVKLYIGLILECYYIIITYLFFYNTRVKL